MSGPEEEIVDLFDYDRYLMGEAPTAPFVTLPGSEPSGSISSASEPHISEFSVSEPSFRSVHDRPATPFARPTDCRSRPAPPPLHWVQSFLFATFLEESHSKIFQCELFVCGNELKYGVSQIKNRRR